MWPNDPDSETKIQELTNVDDKITERTQGIGQYFEFTFVWKAKLFYTCSMELGFPLKHIKHLPFYKTHCFCTSGISGKIEIVTD